MFMIEAKDEYGWFDYASFDTAEAAIAEARSLEEGFPNNVRVIDLENMVCLYGEEK